MTLLIYVRILDMETAPTNWVTSKRYDAGQPYLFYDIETFGNICRALSDPQIFV